MGYVSVKEETGEKLHLSREPSSKSWAILIGLISLGIGAAYYSVDYLLWKMAYISGAVFVGLSCMEEWEDCIMDKKTGKIEVKKQTLVQKLFPSAEGQKIVVAELEECTSVQVEEEDVKYGGRGYLVVLGFASGYSIGVTETATLGDESEHNAIAEKIHNFLQLDKKRPSDPSGPGTPSESPLVTEEVDTASSLSDDSFEMINGEGELDPEDNTAAVETDQKSQELEQQD